MIFVKQKFAGCEWQLKNNSQMMSFSAKNGRMAHISSDVMTILLKTKGEWKQKKKTANIC